MELNETVTNNRDRAVQLLLEADGVREGHAKKSAVAFARRGLTMRWADSR